MLARILKKYAVWVILAVLAMTIFSGFLLPQLKIELDFANYLPSKSTELDFYNRHRKTFGSRDDLLVIGIYRQEGIFDSTFLRKLAALTDSCRQLPLVKTVNSLTNISIPRRTLFGVVSLPLTHPEDPGLLAADSIRVMTTPLLRDRFVSADATTTTVVLGLDPGRTIETSGALISSLDTLLPTFQFRETHLGGTIDMEVRYSRLSQQELQRFVVLSLLMIVVVLWMIYRSWLTIVLSICVFFFSLLQLGGFLVLTGQKLDVMATMVPSIILIVSISDSIHIFSRYSIPEQGGVDQVEGINEVARTNFLTSLTTALGFFTLMLSPMPSLYYFGLQVGIGVLLAYVISILFIPAALFLLRARPLKTRGWFSTENWERVAGSLHTFQQGDSRRIILICLILVVLSLWGITRIDTNRTMVSPMPPRSSVTRSFQFFEEKMAGARDFELAISSPEEGGLLRIDQLRTIDRLHRHLDSLPEIGGLVSPVSYVKFVNAFYHAGNTEFFRLPDSDAELQLLHRAAPPVMKREFSSVIDSSYTRGAFRGRMPDMGKNSANALMAEIDQWIGEELGVTTLDFHHTGTPVLLDLMNDIQIRATMKGLVIALFCVGLLMAVLFFNWRLIGITILVNLIPLVIVAGLMGFLGIELRGGTSIVFTIAFVIAVDDTIHFINNVYFRRRRGVPHPEAIRLTLLRTGQPILLTSIVILLAFLLLTTSGFGNVKTLGILVSMTLTLALLSDLLLAPLLLKKI